MIKSMALEFIIGLMVEDMKVDGRMVNSMERLNTIWMMEQ
jgi:hypothetical protein